MFKIHDYFLYVIILLHFFNNASLSNAQNERNYSDATAVIDDNDYKNKIGKVFMYDNKTAVTVNGTETGILNTLPQSTSLAASSTTTTTTTTTTTSSSSRSNDERDNEFMNEKQFRENSLNESENNWKSLTSSIGTPTSSEKVNEDDTDEDDIMGKYRRHPKKLMSEMEQNQEISSKEFILPDDIINKPTTNDYENEQEKREAVVETKHIYKVPKTIKNPKTSEYIDLISKSSKRSTFKMADDNFDFKYKNNFHLFTHLYDHNYWNVRDLKYNLTRTCGNEMNSYLDALNLGKPWALKASDSSGKYGGQYLFGNEFWLGSKMSCDEVNYGQDKANQIDFAAIELGFFVTKILINLNFIVEPEQVKILQVGQCLPKSCTIDDVTVILNNDPTAKLISEVRLNDFITNNNITGSGTHKANMVILNVRHVPGEYSLWNDPKFYLLSTIFGTVLTLIIIATVYEMMLRANGVQFDSPRSKKKLSKALKMRDKFDGIDKNFEMYQINSENNNIDYEANEKKAMEPIKVETIENPQDLGFCSKFLLCFAVGSNTRTILSTERVSDDSLTCVHGLRLYSLLWTIMVHTYLQLFAIGDNKKGRAIAERTFGYQIVGNATFSVDTFFFIGGLLVTLLFLRSMNKTNSTAEMKFSRFFTKSVSRTTFLVFYRFLRLTPIYFVVVVLNELSLKWTYDKAVFNPNIIDHITCNKYWWRNILYVNNWYPFSEMCMIWSWYLANDMQFYIMAVILLTISKKYFKFSTITIVMFLLSSWIISILFSLKYNYIHKVSDPFESFDILYDKPWQRVGPYIMGMITGYIYFRVKTPPRVPFMVNMILWAISLGILFFLIFGVWDGQLSIIMTSLYVSLGHSAWGFGLIWITLSCCWGLANPINSFFSYRGLFPLSRLTYCTYLIHPVVMMVTSFVIEAPIHLQHVVVLTIFLGNAVLSFIIAFILSLMFEAPVIRLMKIICKK